jgi:PadR family transcriptional regulator, regulatory protein PadR
MKINHESTVSNDELILLSLYGKEMYGLQIVEAIEEATKGSRKINVGTVYPVLSRLEDMGLVSSEVVDGATLAKGGSRRKFYKLTKNGLNILSENQRIRNNLQNASPPGYGNTVYAFN